MILTIQIDLNSLSLEGKKYKWKKPAGCKFCDGRLWGHGFLKRYIEGFKEFLFLKRFICKLCNKTITLTPKDYPKYYSTTLTKIIETLKYRLLNLKWPPWPCINRQRSGHWLVALKNYCQSKFGINDNAMDLANNLQIISESNINFLAK